MDPVATSILAQLKLHFTREAEKRCKLHEEIKQLKEQDIKTANICLDACDALKETVKERDLYKCNYERENARADRNWNKILNLENRVEELKRKLAQKTNNHDKDGKALIAANKRITQLEVALAFEREAQAKTLEKGKKITEINCRLERKLQVKDSAMNEAWARWEEENKARCQLSREIKILKQEIVDLKWEKDRLNEQLLHESYKTPCKCQDTEHTQSPVAQLFEFVKDREKRSEASPATYFVPDETQKDFQVWAVYAYGVGLKGYCWIDGQDMVFSSACPDTTTTAWVVQKALK